MKDSWSGEERLKEQIVGSAALPKAESEIHSLQCE
jgi:hypothetical protein